jgi:general secretion pathway protein H
LTPAGTRSSGRASASGFTLIEVLISFTLLVTLTAVLAPILVPSPARTLRASAGEVATTLRETRRHAQAVRLQKRFLVDTQARRFAIEGRNVWRSLPDDVQVALTTGRSLISHDTLGGIDFFPDGSSTGGRVSLRLGNRAIDVDIEWLTGRIRMREKTR